jgi:phage shock protein C
MSRRRSRRHSRHRQQDPISENVSRFRRRRQGGWGFGLYRNTRDGVVAGVAAGMGDHWDIAPWVIRLMWVGAFIFTGSLALWAYVACWVCMARRSSRLEADGSASDELDYETVEVDMEYNERHHDYRPRKVFRYSDSSSERLTRARDRLDAALSRVEDMESYVTSRQYELNKEFSRL